MRFIAYFVFAGVLGTIFGTGPKPKVEKQFPQQEYSAIFGPIIKKTNEKTYPHIFVYNDWDSVNVNANGKNFDMLVKLPPNYVDSPTKRYPIIVFFHGVGAAGNNLNLLFTDAGMLKRNEEQSWNGNLTLTNGTLVQYIRVAPQGPDGSYWNDCVSSNTLYQYLINNYRVDTANKRMFITGLSQGGTDVVKHMYGNTFCDTTYRRYMRAFAPISKGFNNSTAPFGEDIFARHQTLSTTFRVWAGHGNEPSGGTPTVGSQRLVDTVRTYNTGIPSDYSRFVQLPGAHDNTAWDSAYSISGTTAATNMYRWFMDPTDGVLPPLSTSPHKLKITKDMVYGLEGEEYRGVYGPDYNMFDGDYVPWANYNTTDYDTLAPGIQSDPTTGKIQRLTHDWHRDGLGRGILIEFDTVQWTGTDAIAIMDRTNSGGHAVRIWFGGVAEVEKARWPADFPGPALAPNYTYTTAGSTQTTILPTLGRDSFQYVYIEMDYFATDITVSFRGETSPFGTRDTSILRKRTAVFSDPTALNMKTLNKLNNQGALPGNNPHYPKDSFTHFSAMRFYNAPVTITSPATQLSHIAGMSDPDSVAWVIGNPIINTNRIDIGPFGAGVGGTNAYIVDSIVHRVDGVGILQNIRGTNGFYCSHSGYKPEDMAKNDVTSNPRSRACFERYAYNLECLVAKFYQNASPANPSKYRYQNDRWPGQFGLNFFTNMIEVDNEKDEGFRSDSAYMTPEEMMFMHSIVYDTLKALQPSLIVLTNAFVTGNFPAIRAMIKNAQLYYHSRRPIFDAISWHSTITAEYYDHAPTSDDLLGQHGEFPGRYNERARMKASMQDIERDLGYAVDWYMTEYGYTKDSIGPTVGSPTYSDGSYSLCGAPQVNTHTKYENHGILFAHAFFHYGGIPRMKGLWWYTSKDDVDTGSIYKFNADATNGLVNYINTPRILFPSYYYVQSIVNRFGDYHWDQEIRNDSSGAFVDKWVKDSNVDSAIFIVMNQGRLDGPAISITVNNSGTITRYVPSMNSFTMAQAPQSNSAPHEINVVPTPEIAIYSMKTDAGAGPPPSPETKKTRVRWKAGP
jgi:hypothetical protein